MEAIKEFFVKLFEKFNNFLANTFQIDDTLINLYNEFIAPIPEIFKILGAIFLAIVIVLGVISFVKKLFKLFLVLAIILVIVLVVTRLT